MKDVRTLKIIITAPFSDEGIAFLESYAEIERCGWGVTAEALSEDELIAKAKTCAGIITEVEDVTAKVIESCPELKFIGCTRAVPRTVDVEAATKAGIRCFCPRTKCSGSGGAYDSSSVRLPVRPLLLSGLCG